MNLKQWLRKGQNKLKWIDFQMYDKEEWISSLSKFPQTVNLEEGKCFDYNPYSKV